MIPSQEEEIVKAEVVEGADATDVAGIVVLGSEEADGASGAGFGVSALCGPEDGDGGLGGAVGVVAPDRIHHGVEIDVSEKKMNAELFDLYYYFR